MPCATVQERAATFLANVTGQRPCDVSPTTSHGLAALGKGALMRHVSRLVHGWDRAAVRACDGHVPVCWPLAIGNLPIQCHLIDVPRRAVPQRLGSATSPLRGC